MILTLEREGLIRCRPEIARSIELLIPPEQLPVLRPQPVKSSVLILVLPADIKVVARARDSRLCVGSPASDTGEL